MEGWKLLVAASEDAVVRERLARMAIVYVRYDVTKPADVPENGVAGLTAIMEGRNSVIFCVRLWRLW